MILNKLNDKQLKRLNNEKEQKIYDFIINSRQNEKEDKYIYHLTLLTNEEVIAQFDTEVELEEGVNGIKEKFCEISFIILKVLKKNKDSKLRKNKVLYFNYKNVFKSYQLLEDDSRYTEILLPNQFLKYDFIESTNIYTSYDLNKNTIRMHLYFHPWAQKEKFKLSPKTDLEILIKFFNVENVKGVKTNDSTEWEINKMYVKKNNICFKTNSSDEYWLPEEELDEITFDFEKAELKVIKEQCIGYYKGKYME